MKLDVERNVIADVLSAVLAEHAIEDVSVEDPPLEEVIAEVFAQAEQTQPTDADGEHRSRAEQAPPLSSAH